MSEPIIHPTVGRILWFYPAINSGELGFAPHAGGGGPYAAMIVHVWTNCMVNLVVFDANGMPHSRTSVHLLQNGQSVDEAFCSWMPYQKGQAAMTEALEQANMDAVQQAAQGDIAAFNPGSRVQFLEKGDTNPAFGTNAIDARTDLSLGLEPVHSILQLMPFGAAIQKLKEGACVARNGWNGKGMFIYLNRGAIDGQALGFTPGEQAAADHPSRIGGVPLGLFDTGHLPGVCTRMPNINMRAADGATVTGWLASQTDMLAEDWVLVD